MTFKIITALVILVSTMSVAVASSASSSTTSPPPHKCSLLREPDAQVVTAVEMTCRVTDVIERFGIIQAVDWISLSLVMIFFVSRILGVSATMDGGRKVWPMVMSAGVALSMLFMLPELRGGLSMLFQQSHSLASYASGIVYADNKADLDAVLAEVEAFSSMVLGVCVAAAIEYSEEAGLVASANPDDSGPVGLAGASLEDAILLAAAAEADSEVTLQSGVVGIIFWFLQREFKARVVPFVMNLATGMVTFLASSIIVLADTILLPIAAFNHMVNFGGSLVMIVGSVTLPIGFVLLVAGQGLRFIVNWVKVIIASLITLMVFPAVWTIGVNLAIISPVRTALMGLNDAHAAWLSATAQEEMRQMLNAVMAALGAISLMVVNSMIGLLMAVAISALIGRVVISFLAGAEISIHNLSSASGGSFDPLLPDKKNKDDDKKDGDKKDDSKAK